MNIAIAFIGWLVITVIIAVGIRSIYNRFINSKEKRNAE